MTCVAVDLGCAAHGGYNSIQDLIDVFDPDILYGFDPAAETERYFIGDTHVIIEKKAAWIDDGGVSFHFDNEHPTASRVAPSQVYVPCFDFPKWIEKHSPGNYLIVKMDIEGAEFDILTRMIATGADGAIDELLVEWHGNPEEAALISRRLSCSVGEWWM